MQCAAVHEVIFRTWIQNFHNNRLLDITKVDEIRVPPQKNLGGFSFVRNKATIHGKSPRLLLNPFLMSPIEVLETPQVPTFLRIRADVSANVDAGRVNTQITNMALKAKSV